MRKGEIKMTNLNEVVNFKLKQAKDIEEFIVIAKENNIEIIEKEAEIYFNLINKKTGELNDEELDSVTGGGGYTPNGYLIVTGNFSCEYWEQNRYKNTGTCQTCKYNKIVFGMFGHCQNPNMRK
jgi:hypothetical protein